MENQLQIANEIYQLKTMFGWGVAMIIVVLIILGTLISLYIKQRIESSAKLVSEKAAAKFKSLLDQDAFHFQWTHGKRLEKLHECYGKYQNLQEAIHYLSGREKFYSPSDPNEEFKHLVRCRHEFRKSFNRNKVLFSIALAQKVSSLLEVVDEFISTYEAGLLNWTEEEIEMTAELNNGMYLSGVWGADELTNVLETMEKVSSEMELEFNQTFNSNRSI